MQTYQDDYQRIYFQWDEFAKTGNIQGLLSLYAVDALFESPLVPILLEQENGTIQGLKQLERFFLEGTKRRPNHLVRWYRDGRYLASEGRLIWEYPRQTLDGNQVDIAEVMDIKEGKITHHRIYWGWFGVQLLLESQKKKTVLIDDDAYAWLIKDGDNPQQRLNQILRRAMQG